MQKFKVPKVTKVKKYNFRVENLQMDNKEFS
jgi:hypothetical protein